MWIFKEQPGDGFQNPIRIVIIKDPQPAIIVEKI
jgi:hypothetical protein